MFCENFSFLMILLGLGKGRSVGFYFGLFLEVTKENLMICFLIQRRKNAEDITKLCPKLTENVTSTA